MELLNKGKQNKKNNLPTITGFLSFLFAILSLIFLNAALILEAMFNMSSIMLLPLLSFFLGIAGLFTKNRSRLFAFWGLGISLFLFIFFFLMIIMSLSINYKP